MANLIDEPYRHRPHDLIDYTEAKIKILKEEFLIKVTELDKARVRTNSKLTEPLVKSLRNIGRMNNDS